MASYYINGMGNISPQRTLSVPDFLSSPESSFGQRLACIEPDYNAVIDPKLLRRMSRIIRMGMASALTALREAQVEKPEAIITGTAWGCLEDTGTFLAKMIVNNEQALNPTPFIQSTHNTIGGQIALHLQCHGYNQTYSQRAFSFEHALMDALMTQDQENILVGGIDEITDAVFTILQRFGVYKTASVNSLDLFGQKTKGTIQGEGAAFFVLSSQQKETSYARVLGAATFFKPESTELHARISSFLRHEQVDPNSVDLVLAGKNGDAHIDANCDELLGQLFPSAPVGVYKHLCGEYATASAFALWLSARILKEQRVPTVVLPNYSQEQNIRRVLIYNQYFGEHHSLILTEAC